MELRFEFHPRRRRLLVIARWGEVRQGGCREASVWGSHRHPKYAVVLTENSLKDDTTASATADAYHRRFVKLCVAFIARKAGATTTFSAHYGT